jgi:arylsulfatase
MHVWTHLQAAAVGRTGIGLYPDGMVEHDDMVGKVLQQLDDLGIADNTIVVYGTDNGAETGTWPDGGTTPFHGEKGTTWEGGFRVPMLVRWPGVIKPGSVINDIFSQEDWLPDAARGGRRAGHRREGEERLHSERQNLESPPRRLQLPAVLQGESQKGRAKRSSTLARAVS